ncbi:50S ribosomal protein L10 [Candidatus Dependentiae bacterium]|nr:50S ribosomal protein L10 [Candidatus Dependentiae bacterium]
MNRQQKISVISDIGEKCSIAEASFIINYQGLSVAQMQKLRLALETKNSEMQVAKNRLVRIAFQSKPELQILNDQLRGQNAIVFVKNDLTGTAKVLHDFAKENEEFKIVAGCYESRLLNKETIGVLARIPSREILLAQLCGVLKGPITALVVTLGQVVKEKQGGQGVVEVASENV